MERDNSTTKRFLAEAAIGPGMRVLEIGCGGGEVTQVLAELVGPAGTVVAVDRSDKALATAQDRMKEHGIEQVQLLTADVSGDLSILNAFEQGSFDVLTGRRVLMYLPEPAAVVRQLARWVKGDGLVVFEETDLSMVPARQTPMPAHDQAIA